MSVVDSITSELRIGPHSNGMRMAPEEYDELPPEYWEPGYRYELINGVLLVSPPAGIGERNPNDFLGHLLRSYKASHAEGARIDATAFEQEIPCGKDRRRADRAVWIGLGRKPRPLADVPAIAVEFVSDSSRDRQRDYVEKRKEYALAGVEEFWVIDRFRSEMTVFRGANVNNEKIVVDEQGVYTTPLLPGFELSLAEILEEADWE